VNGMDLKKATQHLDSCGRISRVRIIRVGEYLSLSFADLPEDFHQFMN
jgi:hypothetical protein